MAGFGAKSGAKDSKAPKKITGIPKKTLLNYGDTVKAGAKPYKVFARVTGEEQWYEVGEVASNPDSPDAACTLHKRLALEYAVDLYVELKPKARQLEVGYSQSGQGEDDVVVAKKEVNDAISKDAHGFLPKQKGSKMGAGLYNINGDKVPASNSGKAAGGGNNVNPLGQIVG